MNKFTLAALLVLSAASTAQAADQGSGKITWSGTVVASACSLKAGENGDDQNIGLGGISSEMLENAAANDGVSAPAPFEIQLVGCSFSGATPKNKVTVTFNGTPDLADPKSLALTGTAKGAYLMIEQLNGSQVDLGTATAPQTLSDGNNALRFQARLKGDGGTGITPGDFTATATFVLNYS